MNTGIILHIAINAAIEAGKQIIRVYHSGNFGIEQKNDATPVTIADIESNNVLQKSLAATRLPVLSEEAANIHFSQRKLWKKYWLVDPLDGTKEFIKRNDEFSVNIALMNEYTPVAGIIFAPVTRILYYSLPGKGVFKVYLDTVDDHAAESMTEIAGKAERLHGTTQRRDMVVIASKSHKSSQLKDYITELKKKTLTVKVISMGSALKFGLIAEGAADVYPRFGPTMEWDTAAGHAIMNELGFHVNDALTGLPLSYNKPDLKNPWFIAKNNRV
ncbi:MAG: 3'(2'),5'-bisphosphate nucleotidase CysQ [Bacteroidales bacterium]|nr:3'(2'),5'-bisphosphate nucleotidase CysQ [Bacteroidales bacterium]